MRQTISRADLHRRFTEALAAHPAGSAGHFVFDIDVKEGSFEGCNWYPLAAIQHWTGDMQANLAAFRDVRAAMEREYDVEENVPAGVVGAG
jgi:hypothetical protein